MKFVSGVSGEDLSITGNQRGRTGLYRLPSALTGPEAKTIASAQGGLCHLLVDHQALSAVQHAGAKDCSRVKEGKPSFAGGS
jgi:hypothetical protein